MEIYAIFNVGQLKIFRFVCQHQLQPNNKAKICKNTHRFLFSYTTSLRTLSSSIQNIWKHAKAPNRRTNDQSSNDRNVKFHLKKFRKVNPFRGGVERVNVSLQQHKYNNILKQIITALNQIYLNIDSTEEKKHSKFCEAGLVANKNMLYSGTTFFLYNNSKCSLPYYIF